MCYGPDCLGTIATGLISRKIMALSAQISVCQVPRAITIGWISRKLLVIYCCGIDCGTMKTITFRQIFIEKMVSGRLAQS